MKTKKTSSFRFLILGAALTGLGVCTPSSAAAKTHCFCKAAASASDNLGPHISNALIDFGILKEWTDTYCTVHPNKCKDECKDECMSKANSNSNFSSKDWLCQQIHVQGHQNVAAYRAVGTGDYFSVSKLDMTCTPPVSCACPSPSWLDANVKKCVGNVACQGQFANISQGIPDTTLGTWGFIYKGVVFQITGNPGAGNKCGGSDWYDANLKKCVNNTKCDGSGNAAILPKGIPNATLGTWGFVWNGTVFHITGAPPAGCGVWHGS